MAKFSVFIAIGLLSIVPTGSFRRGAARCGRGRCRRSDAKRLELIRKLLQGELLAIGLILLCAAIMARGGWV